MNLATKKWIFLKISSVILLPLMFWFAVNFIAIYDSNYSELVEFFSNSVSKFLFSLFIIFAYFFSALSISEVFEDYIKNDKIKTINFKGPEHFFFFEAELSSQTILKEKTSKNQEKTHKSSLNSTA